MRRLSAMMHDFMHTLYAMGDRGRLARLSDWFADSDDPVAAPAYGLLNEALATALANGLLAEAMGESDPNRRLYHDDGVHRAAWATIPLVRTVLESGKSLYDHETFATDYLAAVREAFPGGMPVTNHLRPLVCLHSNGFRGVFEHVSRATQASSHGGLAANDAIADADSIELLGRFPSWPTLLFLKPGEVDELSKLENHLGTAVVSEVKSLARQRDAFVFSAHRAKGKGRVSVVVAADESAALRLFDKWISQPTLPFEPSSFYE